MRFLRVWCQRSILPLVQLGQIIGLVAGDVRCRLKARHLGRGRHDEPTRASPGLPDLRPGLRLGPGRRAAGLCAIGGLRLRRPGHGRGGGGVVRHVQRAAGEAKGRRRLKAAPLQIRKVQHEPSRPAPSPCHRLFDPPRAPEGSGAWSRQGGAGGRQPGRQSTASSIPRSLVVMEK